MVVCTAALVALSSEAVGLKLRGTYRPVDVYGYLVTVATFAGPARAA